jgi:hypothetical protein
MIRAPDGPLTHSFHTTVEEREQAKKSPGGSPKDVALRVCGNPLFAHGLRPPLSTNEQLGAAKKRRH